MELNITVSRVAGGSYAIGTMNLAPYKRRAVGGGGRGRGYRAGDRNNDNENESTEKVEKPEKAEVKKAVPPAPRPAGYIPGAERIIPGAEKIVKDKKKNPKKKKQQDTTAPEKSSDAVPSIPSPSLPPPDSTPQPEPENGHAVSPPDVESLVEGIDVALESNEPKDDLEMKEEEVTLDKEKEKEKEKDEENEEGLEGITLLTTNHAEDTKQKDDHKESTKQAIENEEKEKKGEDINQPSQVNGVELTKTQPNISKPVTLELKKPLGDEIRTGQQTFIEIDGSLYLKITPSEPTVKWYTTLQKDFDVALNPPPPPPPVHVKKVNHYQKVEKNNGSLVFVVDVPDFVKENVAAQKKNPNVNKKKKK